MPDTHTYSIKKILFTTMQTKTNYVLAYMINEEKEAFDFVAKGNEKNESFILTKRYRKKE